MRGNPRSSNSCVMSSDQMDRSVRTSIPEGNRGLITSHPGVRTDLKNLPVLCLYFAGAGAGAFGASGAFGAAAGFGASAGRGPRFIIIGLSPGRK